MPFINPPDVLPEAMRFIVRLLLQAEEPVLQAEVVRRISPAGLAEVTSGTPLDEKPKLGPAGRYIVEATLTAMRGAGLVEVSGSDREIGLTPLVSEHFSKWEEVDAETFAQFLLEQSRPMSLRAAMRMRQRPVEQKTLLTPSPFFYRCQIPWIPSRGSSQAAGRPCRHSKENSLV